MNPLKNITIGLSLAMLAALAFLSSVSDLPAAEAAQLAGISESCVTGIQVQILNETNANVSIDFYRQGSDEPSTTVVQGGIPGLAAWNVYLGGSPMLSAGLYSAHATSDRRIGSIVRTDWLSSGGAAIYSNVRASKHVIVPLVTIDYVGQFSQISIQNTDESAEANVTLELLATGSDAPALTEHHTILPFRSITIYTKSWVDRVTPNTPYGFLGSLNITSDVAVGAQSFVDITSSDKAVYAFEGIPAEDSAETLYAPLIRRRHYGYDTGISVSNPNPTAVDVNVTYRGTGGACAGSTIEHEPVSIARNSSHVFYQGPVPENRLPRQLLRLRGDHFRGRTRASCGDRLQELYRGGGSVHRDAGRDGLRPDRAAARTQPLPFRLRDHDRHSGDERRHGADFRDYHLQG